jgi:hypothetical protein
VEFAAELRYFFPSLEISVVSSSEGCVPSMPKGAQDYIQRYFDQHNITKLVKRLGRNEEHILEEGSSLESHQLCVRYDFGFDSGIRHTEHFWTVQKLAVGMCLVRLCYVPVGCF